MELKTQKTEQLVTTFFATIDEEARRADCVTISTLMQAATGAEPVMWGTSIVGFGSRRIQYADGREADWMAMGFSPRKQNLVLYLYCDFEANAALLARLGKHKQTGGCLYIKKLSDIDLNTLKELIQNAV